MSHPVSSPPSVRTEPAADPVRDVAWVVGYFVLAGLVAGLVWWKIVDPPYFVRTTQGAAMDEAQLGRRVQADGWFMTLGALAGLFGALVLARRFGKTPLLTLLLGTVASLGGGLLALKLGTTLGHSDVKALARSAKVGAHIPDSLGLISHMVLAAWSIGFLIGAVAILWGTRSRHRDAQDVDARHEERPVG